MKTTHFYSHLIDTDSLLIELDGMGFTEEQKDHLIALVDSNIHHTVLELILSELSEEDKKAFLEHFVHEKHDKVWEMLNEKVENIEDKIVKAAKNVKEELHKDIKDTKGE